MKTIAKQHPENKPLDDFPSEVVAAASAIIRALRVGSYCRPHENFNATGRTALELLRARRAIRVTTSGGGSLIHISRGRK